jgi:HJR/Mrr/RecB family endonuclease
MEYTTSDIEKVLGYKTWSDKRKQDELLKMDCSLYCHLGTDSTKSERYKVKKMSRKIYLAIKTINHSMGVLFLSTMDQREKERL